MASNLALDDELIEEAMKLSGARSKKDAVNTALSEYIKALKRKQILKLKGRENFDPAYEYKKGRSR